jgi:hypothetical protein
VVIRVSSVSVVTRLAAKKDSAVVAWIAAGKPGKAGVRRRPMPNNRPTVNANASA